MGGQAAGRQPGEPGAAQDRMGAGHGGPSGRYDAWRDEAFVYAFILDALGLADAPLAARTPADAAGRPAPSAIGRVVVDGLVAGPEVDGRTSGRRGAGRGGRRRSKVATNGVCTGVGRTTGTVSIARVTAGVPSCTVVAPDGLDPWTVPAWSTPAQTVEPVATESTGTQHVPVAGQR